MHRRLADDARRSSRSVPWADEPWASLGAPRPHRTPPLGPRAPPPADRTLGTIDAPTAATTVAAAHLIAAQTPLVVAARAAGAIPCTTADDAHAEPTPGLDTVVANAAPGADHPRRRCSPGPHER